MCKCNMFNNCFRSIKECPFKPLVQTNTRWLPNLFLSTRAKLRLGNGCNFKSPPLCLLAEWKLGGTKGCTRQRGEASAATRYSGQPGYSG